MESTGDDIQKSYPKCHFFYPSGKPRIPYLLRSQGLAVVYYGIALGGLGYTASSTFGCGRNASYLAPPAQIPACGTTALGSYLG